MSRSAVGVRSSASYTCLDNLWTAEVRGSTLLGSISKEILLFELLRFGYGARLAGITP
jgi:hypothetical protein